MFMKKLFTHIFAVCLIATLFMGCSKSCPPPCYVQLERNGVAYNNSDYRLFVAGDYTTNQTERFATTIDPHSSATIMIFGYSDNYHVHFAYKQ